MTRTFRAVAAVAESVRATLDAEWGYPNTHTMTVSAFRAVNKLPTDSQGRVYLRVAGRYCDYAAVNAMLPSLIANGDVEEISDAEYWALFPPRPLPAPSKNNGDG